MKFLVPILAIFVFLNFSTANANTKKILITLSDDYPPVSMGSGTKLVGITHDILIEVFRHHPEFEISIEGYPWARAQEMVKNGSSDAMATAVTDARKLYANPSKHAVFTSNFKPFTYASNPNISKFLKYKNIKDFSSASVCEYSSSGWAKDHLVSVIKEMVYSNSIITKFGMLWKKRCDIAVDSDLIFRYLLKENKDLHGLIELPIVFEKVDFHFLVSKLSKNPEILGIFDREIIKMKKDGRLNKIMKKWSATNN